MEFRSKMLTMLGLLMAILAVGTVHANGVPSGIFYGQYAGPHGPYLLCLSPDYSSVHYENGNITRRLKSHGAEALIEHDSAGKISGIWDLSRLYTSKNYHLNDHIKRADTPNETFYPVDIKRFYLPSESILDCPAFDDGINDLTLKVNSQASPALHALSVSAGSGFTCALLDSHQPRCWGDDSNGAVGSDQGSQVARINLTEVISLEVDDFNSYALLTSGKLYRWGGGQNHGTGDHPAQLNQHQLNFGYNQGNPCQPFPNSNQPCIQRTNRVTLLEQPDEYKSLLAVVSHRCKVTTNGNIGCKGDLWPHQEDQYGNLRPPIVNGVALKLFKTVRIPISNGALSVVSGREQDCALLVNHTVSCWSYRGIQDQPFNPPVSLPLHEVQAISGNQEDMCALLENGTVHCWSDLYASHSDSRNLIDVSGITHAIQISVGPDHGCAVIKGGGLSCWGENYAGALGSLAHWRNDSERYVAYPVLGFVLPTASKH